MAAVRTAWVSLGMLVLGCGGATTGADDTLDETGAGGDAQETGGTDSGGTGADGGGESTGGSTDGGSGGDVGGAGGRTGGAGGSVGGAGGLIGTGGAIGGAGGSIGGAGGSIGGAGGTCNAPPPMLSWYGSCEPVAGCIDLEPVDATGDAEMDPPPQAFLLPPGSGGAAGGGGAGAAPPPPSTRVEDRALCQMPDPGRDYFFEFDAEGTSAYSEFAILTSHLECEGTEIAWFGVGDDPNDIAVGQRTFCFSVSGEELAGRLAVTSLDGWTDVYDLRPVESCSCERDVNRWSGCSWETQSGNGGSSGCL